MRFNAGGYVDQGNQPTMHVAWLFNWAGQPWLSQKWTRAILDAYYGFNPADAYLGDEDQGQMSAWFLMSALGLFQTDGGCRVNPIYEIGSPLYPKITLHLSPSITVEKPLPLKLTGRLLLTVTSNQPRSTGNRCISGGFDRRRS